MPRCSQDTPRSEQIFVSALALLFSTLLVPRLASGDTVVIPPPGLEPNPSDCSFTGQVKAVRIETARVNPDGSEGARTLSRRCSFDRQAHSLKVWSYPDEQLFTSIYDAQGHNIESDIANLSHPRHTYRHVVTFDAHGRAIESKSFEPDGTLNYHTVYTFDARGDLIKETSYDDSGHPANTTVSVYDSGHHLLSAKFSGRNGGVFSADFFRYDQAGRVIERTIRSPAGTTLYRFSYEQQGRVQSVETIPQNPAPPESANLYGICGDCGPFPGRTITHYDDRGRILEIQVIQPPDKLIQLSRYAYDAQGHHTEDWTYYQNPSQDHPLAITLQLDGKNVSFDRSNGLPSTTYTYDSHGNWIKAVVTTISSAEPNARRISAVTHRSLKYY